jgi:hypothetical protein
LPQIQLHQSEPQGVMFLNHNTMLMLVHKMTMLNMPERC